jgi:hypothetical protein
VRWDTEGHGPSLTDRRVGPLIAICPLQHVTVKHIHQQVNVTEGGQAVVAGDTVTRGRGSDGGG